MFLNNKYTKWYNNIITKAEQKVNRNGYHEKHHIIPKSIGGSNDESNLIYLTAKEHFVCHLLLTKMFDGEYKSKMIRAFWMIATMGNKNQERKKVGSRIYCRYKELWLKHGNLNKPKTEEHKQNLRGPKSQEHKNNISKARIGVSTGPRSNIQKEAAGKIWRNISRREECCCLYCEKTTSIMNFVKWHGDNCKQSPNYIDRKSVV